MEAVEEDLNYCAMLLASIPQSVQLIDDLGEARDFHRLAETVGDVRLRLESIFLTLKSVKDYMEAHDV